MKITTYTKPLRMPDDFPTRTSDTIRVTEEDGKITKVEKLKGTKFEEVSASSTNSKDYTPEFVGELIWYYEDKPEDKSMFSYEDLDIDDGFSPETPLFAINAVYRIDSLNIGSLTLPADIQSMNGSYTGAAFEAAILKFKVKSFTYEKALKRLLEFIKENTSEEEQDLYNKSFEVWSTTKNDLPICSSYFKTTPDCNSQINDTIGEFLRDAVKINITYDADPEGWGWLINTAAGVDVTNGYLLINKEEDLAGLLRIAFVLNSHLSLAIDNDGLVYLICYQFYN